MMTFKEFLVICLLLALFVFIGYCAGGTIYAHPHMLLQCQKYTEQTQAELKGEYLLMNGLLAENYDTNGDGQIDTQTLSVVTGYDRQVDGEIVYTHEEYPIRYLVDIDHNNWPDYMVIDVMQNGQCDSLVTGIDGTTAAGKERMLGFIKKLQSQRPGEQAKEGM